MQPQDSNQPTNQPQDSTQTSGAMPAAQPLDPQNPMSGGTTIQPQAGGVSSTAPAWQNDAAADASQLYAQPAPAATGGDSTPQPTAAMPPNPLHDEGAMVQNQNNTTQAMANDFSNDNLTVPAAATIAPIGQTEAQPVTSIPQATPTNQPEAITSTQSEPAEPSPQATESAPPNISQPMNDPYATAPATLQQGSQATLPGSENLGSAVASLYQPDNPGQQPGMPAQISSMPTSSYGPPPKKGKAVIFVIIGVVIGLAAIAGGVFFFLRNRSATSTQPTPTPTPSPAPTPTPSPTSGPATPPAGYVTITKQCYTFALYDPNTVPADQTCSFADATFGKLNVSKISVQTTTEAYKTIDEYLALFEPTVTVVEKNDVSLDGQPAKQLIYKAADGKTYSQVALLVVGKNYQQDGKAVTGLSLTTSYQDSFDKEVTPNVISTWRWQ